MLNNISKLENILKIKFNNINLLLQAVTHKSYNRTTNYETLEFLGDRVLGLIIANKLIELYPLEKVGVLDKKFSSLVNKDMCFHVGIKLKLNNFILVGNLSKKKTKLESKIISDSCEAVIGAIYLDKGYDVARKFILYIWNKYLNLSIETIIDPKTKLQELSLKKYKALPIYKVFSNTGPRHKPNFTIGVKIKNTNFIYSTGSSKKNAEQAAAKKLLKNLKNL